VVTKKFSETDRRRVIKHLEEFLNIKLTPIGRSRKYLSGSDGRKYCILGGYGEWHGVPSEILTQDHAGAARTNIIVARLLTDRIELFLGPIEHLFNNKNLLPLNKQDEYQFHIKKVAADRMYINELPDFYLSKIYEFLYGSSDRNIARLEDIIKTLSPEDREEVLSRLQSELDT